MTPGSPAEASVVATGASAISLSGTVTANNVSGLRREGERMVHTRDSPLVVDISAVSTAHSILLSLLMCWSRKALSENKVLEFTGVGDRLRALAKLSGLDRHLPGF